MIPGSNTFSLSMIQDVIDYIEENILQELTIAKVAAHFYVSVSSLTLSFKSVCGVTIMEYIRNRRLSLAGEELSTSNISIINLAYKYGYETPEAFTKAFSRFHGFPPSFVRRAIPITKVFHPLKVDVIIQGGWNDIATLTESDCSGQDQSILFCYDDITNNKGGKTMVKSESKYQVDVSTMQYQKEWNILCSLARELLQNQISFKVDGKTMIFAHGLEFPLDKICLTFKWNEEKIVKDFFHCDAVVKSTKSGFKYFDVMFKGMKIRCMFYGDCPGADTDEFLYRNTDLVKINDISIAVQSLQFYYENAETDTEYYKMVEDWLKK